MSFDILNIDENVTAPPPIIVVYGPPGVGKTTWAAQAPNAFYVDMENGAAYMPGIKRASLMPDKTKGRGHVWETLESIIGQLIMKDNPYHWLVLDSLSAMQNGLFDYVSNLGGKNSIEDFAYGKGYVRAQESMTRLFTGLDKLKSKNIGTIIIGHEMTERRDDPNYSSSYMFKQPFMNEKIRDVVRRNCDALLFADFDREVSELEGKIKIKQKNNRLLFLRPTAGAEVKNRLDPASQMKNPLPLEFSSFWAEYERILPEGFKLAYPADEAKHTTETNEKETKQ